MLAHVTKFSCLLPRNLFFKPRYLVRFFKNMFHILMATQLWLMMVKIRGMMVQKTGTRLGSIALGWLTLRQSRAKWPDSKQHFGHCRVVLLHLFQHCFYIKNRLMPRLSRSEYFESNRHPEACLPTSKLAMLYWEFNYFRSSPHRSWIINTCYWQSIIQLQAV